MPADVLLSDGQEIVSDLADTEAIEQLRESLAELLASNSDLINALDSVSASGNSVVLDPSVIDQLNTIITCQVMNLVAGGLLVGLIFLVIVALCIRR